MDSSELQFIISRLLNRTNSAEGTLIPQGQVGASRVPTVTGLTLLQTVATSSGTNFVLSWNDVQSPNVDHYTITVTGVPGQSQTSRLMSYCKNSPVTVFVGAPNGTVVTFTVQTVLATGLLSDFNLSPQISGACLPFDFSNTVITAAVFIGGTFTGGTFSGGTFTGGTYSLNLNGVTTTIDNHAALGTFTGLEVQENSSGDAALVTPKFIELSNTDPNNGKPRINLANNATAGIITVYDGTGAGGPISTHGERVVLDGSNGNVSIGNTAVIFGSGGVADLSFPNAVTGGTLTTGVIGIIPILVGGVSYKIPFYS